LLRKEFFGTGVTGIEYRVKEKVVRKTLEDVVGASRDDIEDVMWGDSFRDGLGSKNDGRKNERTLESLLAYHMTHKPTQSDL